MCCTSEYANGESHGPYRRFHPNGEVSQEGVMNRDVSEGNFKWWRSTAESPEVTLPAGVADNAWRMEAVLERGKNYPLRFFDRAGEEVLVNGEPVPQRPESVPAVAVFSPEEEQWFHGLGASNVDDREGLWRWWTTEGKIQCDKDYRGGNALRERYYDDGVLEQEQINDVHGHRIRTVQFDEHGEAVTSSGEPLPSRPSEVPAAAMFDAEDERWVSGEGIEGGVERAGKWTLWTSQGIRAGEYEYIDGKEVAERKFHDDGRLFVERLKDVDGNDTRTAFFYSDGDLNHSIDRTFEAGELVGVEVHVYERGLKSKAHATEQGLQYEFFGADKSLEARGYVKDGRAVGRWEFLGESEPHVLDLTEHELRADVDEDFEPAWLLGRVLLESEGSKPRAPQLVGVDDIDWDEVPSCYGDVENFPALLQAMTSDVEAVRGVAFDEISGETLHQGTVYVATAKIVPFFVGLLEHPNADKHQILSFLEEVASAASPYAAQAKEWDEDDDDRLAVLGTLAAISEGFASLSKYAASEDPAVRGEVVALAAHAGDQGRDLLETIVASDDAELRAVAVHSLLGLPSFEAADATPLFEHDDALVRCVAATTIARRLGPDAPEGTVAALASSLRDVETLGPRFGALTFVQASLPTYLALSSSAVRNEESMALAVSLAAHLPKASFADSPSLCQGLFGLTFGTCEPPFAPGFIEVLEVVSECETFDGYVNFFEVAEAFGLPRDRRDYRGLAQTLRRQDDPEAYLRAQMHGE